MRLPAILVAALAAGGCGPSFETATPDTFVVLDNDDDRYDYRAATAEGVVIAVREIDNEVGARLAFWLTAIKDRVRRDQGYALLGAKPVKSADGIHGTQLRFGDGEHLYDLSVFVTPEKIWLLEAGGSEELVKASAKKIDQAVASFRTN